MRQRASKELFSVNEPKTGQIDADQFEDWLDQQVLPPDIVEHANFVLAYLRMDQPLPAPLRRELARHVAAVSIGR